MRVKCNHGYFIFEEVSAGQLSHFVTALGLELASKDNYFTFPELLEAPDYSIEGATYMGAPATVTTEGKPWDVMRENGLVFDFSQSKVVPIASITKPVQIKSTTLYYLSEGLIVPGSVTDDGKRVKDYAGFFSFSRNAFKYSEVIIE